MYSLLTQVGDTMARDDMLDRLKDEQDRAFQRKQHAYAEMQRAWDKRARAAEAKSRAYDVKQSAYEPMDRAWQHLQSVRSYNGPRIDSLNSQQESAFENMKRAFDRASSAYDSRDGAAASSYAAEGHSYKAEAQRCVQERRQLVEEIRQARDAHAATKPAFERARAEFDSASREFASAKADHERAAAAFKVAKAEFDNVRQQFSARLEYVRSQNVQNKRERMQIAERAGIPYAYRDNVWIKTDASGTINIYFGGAGSPDGPGHGHYVLDSSGTVTYRRDPFDPHGSQNFERDPSLETRLASAALSAYQQNKTNTAARVDQYHDGTVTVKVKSGFDRSRNTVVTDVIVIDRQGSPDEHLHLILSEQDGSVLFSEWRKNH